MNISLYDELFIELKQILKNTAQKPYIYKVPPKKKEFPLVVMYEIRNDNLTKTVDGIERLDEVGYEFQVYTYAPNPEESVKSAYSIINDIDLYMHKKGFERVSVTSVPNIDDSIYRIIARYNGTLFLNRNRII